MEILAACGAVGLPAVRGRLVAAVTDPLWAAQSGAENPGHISLNHFPARFREQCDKSCAENADDKGSYTAIGIVHAALFRQQR